MAVYPNRMKGVKIVILITIDELQGKYGKEIENISGGPTYFSNQHPNIPYEEIEIMITYGLQDDWCVLDQLPNLKWIQIFQTGIEFAPLEKIEQRLIQLTNVRDIYGTAISEYVMSIVLYETKEIERFIQNQKLKKYDRTLLADEVGGKTIGIFGTGAIGKVVAQKAQAFEMNVLGFNTTGNPVPYFDETYTWNRKNELIEKCDFLVLLLPLLEETRHFLDDKDFRLMKDNAYIINVGRGPLINEKALLKALRQDRIKGAALDVFDQEPLPISSLLWEEEKIILTPHLAGKTMYFYKRCLEIYKKNFLLFEKQEPLDFLIDFKRGY